MSNAFLDRVKAEAAFKTMKDALYKAVYAEVTQTIYKELNEKINQIIETQARINKMQEELNQKTNLQ